MPKPGNKISHLWIVITEPDPVIVSVTTMRHLCDKTTILKVGDHDFINHDSIVFYGDSQIVKSKALDEAVAYGAAIHKNSCSSFVLRRIQAGLLISPETPNKVLKFYKSETDFDWP